MPPCSIHAQSTPTLSPNHPPAIPDLPVSLREASGSAHQWSGKALWVLGLLPHPETLTSRLGGCKPLTISHWGWGHLCGPLLECPTAPSLAVLRTTPLEEAGDTLAKAELGPLYAPGWSRGKPPNCTCGFEDGIWRYLMISIPHLN